MPAPTQIGAPIKARLSAKYRESLSEAEQALARRIVKRLRRTTTDGTGAAGKVLLPGRGRVGVEVSHGKVRIGEGGAFSSTGEPASASVADTVCAGVKAGLFADSSGAGNGEPQGQSSEGSPEDSQSSSESDSDGQNGDGDGSDSDDAEDAASEAESDADGDSESESESAEQSAESQSNDRDDDEHSIEYLIRRLREIADYCESGSSEVTDVVSNRAYIDGAKMLRAGIPVRAILHAWAINWPETARQAVGIDAFDPHGWNEVDGRHSLYGYVRALVEADVSVFLKGPTQAGKSYVLAEVAADMGIPFRACPLIAGASSSWLLGAWTPDGFVEAGFPQVYEGGGIFLFDEVDAADPNMITVLNNALTNGSLENPRQGTVLDRSPGFRAAGAANTWGTGATADHTGRARLDKATLERFRLGRIEFGYDRELQARLARERFHGADNGAAPEPEREPAAHGRDIAAAIQGAI